MLLMTELACSSITNMELKAHTEFHGDVATSSTVGRTQHSDVQSCIIKTTRCGTME